MIHKLDSVPTIDIAPFLHGTPAQRAAVAQAVDHSNREIGFLVITGHGFDEGLLRGWFALSKAFFEGDAQAKRAVLAPPGQQQGYHRLANSGLAGKQGQLAPPDLREYFMAGQLDLGREALQTEAARHFHRPNRWPAHSGFQRTGEAYYRAMEGLGDSLMRLFALALGLPEHWFADKFDHHFSILSSIYYPVQEEPPLPGQLRAGAHTDYGSLTILAPNEAPGGLQVRTRSGQWLDVPFVPGGFVINIGDMMQRWTNGRWVSNLHRVLNPGSQALRQPRQSVAFFMHPNHDALIECIATCRADGEPPRHPAITAGDYMLAQEKAIGAAAAGQGLGQQGIAHKTA